MTQSSSYPYKITFSNGEVRVFDVKPYLNTGLFKELKDVSIFNSVKPFLGSIQWANGLTFALILCMKIATVLGVRLKDNTKFHNCINVKASVLP